MKRYGGNSKIEHWNGDKGVYHDNEYYIAKYIFIRDENDLKITGFKYSNKKLNTVWINDFKSRTAISVINNYPEAGRHFNQGILEIWKYYELPLDYMVPILKELK
jgi:hypothetical protein